MTFLQISNLCKDFGKHRILSGINLSIDKGIVYAVIGPTGAGKTTLIRLIDLLDTPSSGQIFFDGVDVTHSGNTRNSARRRMALVQQKPIVFKMNVFGNIACGLRWRRRKKEEIQRKVNDVLEIVGMGDYRDRDARTLSGGEMQRVAIARALVVEPEVLLLDEPTSNLDPVSVSKIEDVLAHIIKERKTTILMSTHDMSQGQRLADKICVLIDGELLQIGSPKDIFCAPATKQVAEFVGVENILPGIVARKENELAIINVNGAEIQAITDLTQDENVFVMIRPEDITFTRTRDTSSARNVFEGRINRIIPLGPLTRVEIDCGISLLGIITTRSASEMELTTGSKLFASFKATAIHVIKRA